MNFAWRNMWMIVLVLLAFSCKKEEAVTQVSEPNQVAKNAGIPEPRTYVAHKITAPLIIDGKADESAWQQAVWTDSFIDIEGEKAPTYLTKVKMLWDETYYYLLAEMEEPHVWGNLTEHDGIMFHNNDFEVFIDPEGNNHGYYEIEVNSLNTVWDLFITKAYRELNQPVLNDWHATGMKSAIHVNGTLNHAGDTDKGWTLEMAIPWSVFKTSYFHDVVPRNDFWRVNFSRVNWDFELENGEYVRKKGGDGKLLPEYNWVWSPMWVINMHQPEKWGYVYFSENALGNATEFKIPSDEKIAWKLYEAYRQQTNYYLKNKEWKNSLSDLGIEEFIIDGELIRPTIDNHSMGYNLTVKSPFTQNLIIVREDGERIIKTEHK